jgi:hypothetical protein
MTNLHAANRRTVLKTIGAGVVGAATVSGTATARRSLVSRVNSTGSYVIFRTLALNRRSKNPIDFQEEGGDGRWVSEPTWRGNVRLRIENDGGTPPLPNAGFFVDVGPIGDIESITIDATSVRSAGDAAQLTAGLVLDVDGDGDYFAWDPLDGNSERFVGFGDDAEALVLPLSFSSDVPFTIAAGTPMAPLTEPKNATFGDYTDGMGIDPATQAGIQVSVLGGGEEATEEAIVKGVSVQRS